MKKHIVIVPLELVEKIKNDPVRAYFCLRILGLISAKTLVGKTLEEEDVDQFLVKLFEEMEQSMQNIKIIQPPLPEDMN